MLFIEQYGSLGDKIIYKIDDACEQIGIKGCERSKKSKSFFSWIAEWLRFTLLPQGYPASVSSDYLSYQLWDTLQAFCSYLSGTLTTRAIMQGVGVGDAAATPLAATITWIMRDGTGMIGRILFATWKGPSLDANCKQWRLAADILNDLAMTIELYSPMIPDRWFSLALCLATSMKSIVGVAGGATRAALTQHQARRGNMADVAAKDGSQETLVNLIASMAGIVMLPLLTNDVHCWILFLCLSFVHLFANYKAVKALKIPIFNEQRLNMFLVSYWSSRGNIIETPSITNAKESVLIGTGLRDRHLCGFRIKLGASLGDVSGITPMQLKLACCFSDEYIILPSLERKIISVIFHVRSIPPPALQAYFHAAILGIKIDQLINKNKRQEAHFAGEFELINEAMKLSQNAILEQYPDLVSDSNRAGWITSKHQLLVDEWQADWRTVTAKFQ